MNTSAKFKDSNVIANFSVEMVIKKLNADKTQAYKTLKSKARVTNCAQPRERRTTKEWKKRTLIKLRLSDL